MTNSDADLRAQELSAALAALRERIASACAAAGRAPGEVVLLPVTKTFPVTDARILFGLGERAFGENKAQEAEGKAAALAELLPEAAAGAVRWHMLGHVQRNKAGAVARWASAVHSVDSLRIVDALSRGAAAALASGARNDLLRMMIQVSLDGDPSRGGAPVDTLEGIAERVCSAPAVQLSGLMAVPPLTMEPERAFAELAELRARLRQRFPQAQELSAGMSADLELAVQYGSTCVRVGTALLGRRPITSR